MARREGHRRLGWLAPLLLVVIGCTGTLPPLRHKLEVGRDAYAILAADAPDGRGELYALGATSEEVVQLTFSRAVELAPAISPDGVTVAFLRSPEPDDSSRRTVWVLNLLNGAERELELPAIAGQPIDVAWSRAGDILYVRTTAAVYRVAPPPAPPAPSRAPAAEREAAESSFTVLIGEPVFARVEGCQIGLCVRNEEAKVSPLVEAGREPVRWGPDSVGYVARGELVVRPLGPGRSRVVRWSPAPKAPRDITYFPGAVAEQ